MKLASRLHSYLVVALVLVGLASSSGPAAAQAVPSLSINSPTVTEGDSGSADLQFVVTLSPASLSAVTVAYADAGTGTATSGTDYTALASGTLTFLAGETTKTVTVAVQGDTLDEPGETVQVQLSAATEASISSGTGTGTITDDDDQPSLSISSPSVTEGNSGSANLLFKVTLSAASGRQVTVRYADSGGGTATSGTDYTALTAGTLTFAAGDTEKTVTVRVTGDTLDEANETVAVTLSSASNASIGTASGSGTITDDDEAPSASISSPSVAEGDTGTATLAFVVTLSAASGRNVFVGYAHVGGSSTATAGTDFRRSSYDVVSFSRGETSKTISITVNGDELDEFDETVVLQLSARANGHATVGTGTGTGTITDDDPEPSLSISSPSVAEGNSGTANLEFAVTLSAASGKQVTVAYADAGSGTATSGTDYTALATGTLTFAAGDTAKTVTVAVRGDTLHESAETVEVQLSGASNASIDSATGTGTITNDDGSGLSISSPSVTEGDSGSADLQFVVTLSPASPSAATVEYADAGTGTATSGTDYTALASGTLSFAAGETTKTVTVAVQGDTLDEPGETVQVQLSAASGATISTATGTGTITDDDDPPSLSISSPSVTEGNTGSANLLFKVTLSAASGKQVTVRYADSGGGTATSGTDYTALTAGTLTFAAGDTEKTVTVLVTGDTLDEANETVAVTLSSASNASLGTATGSGTITDDDAAPSASISSPSVAEGDTGTATLAFVVTLSAASGRTVFVGYAHVDNRSTATAGTDFKRSSHDLVSFSRGETSKTISITVNGDEIDEVDETVVLQLSARTNGHATVGTGTGTGTITDDDPEPSLSISSPSVVEGNSGSANLEFAVTLSAVSGKQVTVVYADAGSGTATSGTDYTALTSGTLTFVAGDTAKTVTVAARGDTLNEADETVQVQLSAASNASIATATGTGTITNDDASGLSISSPSVTEGDSGSADLQFVVTLSPASPSEVTVAYADAGSGTATSGTDYTALASGTLTFAAGDTAKTVTVAVQGDTLDEPGETVQVQLSGASGATISSATGTGTITDDDPQPRLSISSPSVAEGNTGSANLLFKVTLSAASGKQVTVRYADAGSGTATSGTDYTALASGTLTFAAGDTEKTVTVRISGDTLDEANETVAVTLSSASNASIGTAAGSGTITDDDAAPSASISSPSVAEGDSGTVTLAFVVTLSAVSGRNVFVGYSHVDNRSTATAGTDFKRSSFDLVSFNRGQTSKTISITVNGDELDEPDETVVLQLSARTNGHATVGTGTGTGTITDDDPEPSLSISSPSVGEGDSGTANLLFRVALSAVSGKQVTVVYADAGSGTATSGTDYTALVSGTLTFAAGDTAKTVTVAARGDTLDESDETVQVQLSAASNASIGTGTGTGTITDDDASELSISSPSVAEGNSGTANLNFGVTLSPASASAVTVAYADAGSGTATSGTDYTALTAGTLSFAAGETTKTVTVEVRGDNLDELDETVKVTLSSAVNAGIGTATGTGTITDDDDEPSLSISSPSVTEGNSGSANLLFKVTLSAASGRQVTVRYADGGVGTATSGTDYAALTAGTLTFAAGDTEKTVTVRVSGDTIDEPNETVAVSLSSASNASLGTATGSGTITDDDPEPSLSISSPSVGEGDSGTANLEFEVTLSAASGKQVTVEYADAGSGTATSGTDYTALATGTLTFAPGDTAKTVTMAVRGDTLDELNETVKVTLSSAVNAGIGTATGTGTITDDDDQPSLSISSPSVGEGDSGTANLEFEVTLSAASGKQVTVVYADAGSGTATSGTDYTALATGTLTFAAGDTAKTVTVAARGDTLNETDETVKVTLSGAVNASIGTATGTGTITDDDARPSLSISSPSVGEGDSGTANLEFAVTLSAASALQVTVAYADAGSGTATSGTDYTALTAGTLTFAAGDTAKTVTVAARGDALDEPDETVKVTLSAAMNAGIGTATGTGTITDDDPEPNLSISSPSVGEADSGTANLEFEVTLSAASGKQVTVAYADAGTGTATSGTDYTALAAGTLTFAAGDTAKTVTVAARGDTLDEPDETVKVTLSSAVNAGIGTATGTGTITDDDDQPSLSISSPSVGEGDSGTANLEFEVTLSAASGKQVTVDYADAGSGTATSGTDYTALVAGTLTFAAGDTAKTVTVEARGDSLNETDETVKVTLSGAVNAGIGIATGTGTITDDDARPALSISSPSVGEGDSGTADLEFAVTLSAASALQVTVAYADAGSGTATSGTDYTALTAGTLTFAAGDTAKTITVAARGDTLDEPDETVKVTLSAAMNAGIGTATGTGTITDDDPEPNLSISSPSVGEGDSGTANLEFEVTLSAASGKQVTVAYADAGSGTATSGTDYTALAAGTLTFTAGDTAKTVTVEARGDSLNETDETVKVTLSGAVNAGIGTATGTGTITDDDARPALSISSPSVGEGDSGTADLEFAVTLSAASALQVTVAYADAGSGTATSGTDYTALVSGTLTFAAGDTAKTITVAARGDTLDEFNETVKVTLSSATNAGIGTATGTGTITDDDPEPSLSISSPSVGEGDSGTANLEFEVTLSAASGKQVTVEYADAGSGTATSGTDYTALVTATLTFAAGDTAETVTVLVRGDTLNETDETVKVTLSGAVNAGIGTATGTGTITDDDAQPALSISSPSVGEGDSGTADLEFEVTLSAASALQVTVAYADAGTGTATSGTDYTALTAGTLTFVAGETAKTVTVAARGDTLDEPNETVKVTLSAATNAGIGTATGTGTITDDDDEPSLSISSPSVGEGDSGTANLEFAVTLSAASGKQVTVVYADAGRGTATSGTDYTALATGTLTFMAGQTEKTITVAVRGDTVHEANETVQVTLSGPTNATVAVATGTGEITNDDQPTPQLDPAVTQVLTISSPSASEGDSGSSKLAFTVVLQSPSNRQVKVEFVDSGLGSATAGEDYVALAAGVLTFAPGVTSQTINVIVMGDTEEEDDETIQVTLREPTNAVIQTSTGIGTIVDDDTPSEPSGADPSIAITSPTAVEMDSGATSTLAFAVTLSEPNTQVVTVKYSDTGTGTATAGTDYVALADGTLTFSVGQTSKTIEVSVIGDSTAEPDETLHLQLSDPTYAEILESTGTGTIIDDDLPTVSIDSPTVSEGDHDTSLMPFIVTLSTPSTDEVTVGYVDSRTGTATSGEDYEALEAGTLTFTAGETRKTVSVAVAGDEVVESNETVVVNLSTAAKATIKVATGEGTIADDDGDTEDDDRPGVAVEVDSPSVLEGQGGLKALVFTVRLKGEQEGPVEVSYVDARTGTAESGADYEALPEGTLTFASAETSQSITVFVIGDTTDEVDETVVIRFAQVTNASSATVLGVGTIVDDDTVQVDLSDLRIDSPVVREGAPGTLTALNFTVTLGTLNGGPLEVRYEDARTGSAQPGEDYDELVPGTLRFTEGDLRQTISVKVRGDLDEEPDETVQLALSFEGGEQGSSLVGTGTIVDDDTVQVDPPDLRVDSPMVREGAPGTFTALNFIVTLGALNGGPVEVLYEDARTGSAKPGEDYDELVPGTLRFTEGDMRQTISVRVRGDLDEEPDETVQLALSFEGGERGSSLVGTGTIADDDSDSDPGDGPAQTPPEIRIDSPSVQEGPPGTTSILEFTLTLSAAATEPITVNYFESDSGTASAGTDYEVLPAATLTFAAGETAKAISVTVIGDDEVEPDETVVLMALADPENGRDAAVRGLGTIINDDIDLAPTFGDAAIAAQRFVEGARIDPLVLPTATSGTGDLTYSLSPAPPDGLVFNLLSRRLSGTPAVPLEATFYEYTATDEDGDTATLAFTIEVAAAGADARRELAGVNRTLLPEVARAWTQVTSEAVAGRVERVATGADGGAVGQSLASVAETLHRSERTLNTAEERRRSRMELAGTQPFALSLGGVGGAQVGFWGDGDFRSLSGELRPIGWTGTTFAGGAGLDVRLGSTMLAGIAASRFESTFDYGNRSGESASEGTHTSTVSGLHPYVGWTMGTGTRMWATAGFGAGAIEIDDEEYGRQVTDGRLRSGAVGGRFRLYSTGEGPAATQLDLRAEGQFGRMEIEGNGDLIEGLAVGVHRVRAAMEGSHSIAMGKGRTLTPSVAVGVRRDGGDGRIGTGAELSGRMNYADPASGMAVEANGRVLLAHTGDAGEWGFGAAISFDPGQEGRGLAFRVEPRLGTAENGMQRLWNEGMVDARRFEDGAHVPLSRSESEVGYGLPVLDGRCLLTPYSGLSIGGQGYREYRLGSRLEIGPDFRLALESSRRERERMVPDYRLAIEMRLAW